MAAPASASAKAIEAGHEVGPYVLTREIGKGSFAVVFQGKIHAPLEKQDNKIVSDDEGIKDEFDDRSLDSSASTSRAAERRHHRRSSSTAVTRVAIKVVTRKKLTAKLLENLEGEISILRTIRHANIVELLDCLKTGSHIYLVMQFCRMGDLSVFIRTRRRPSERERDASATALATRGVAGTSRQKDTFEDEMDKLYPHPHDGGLHDELVRSFLAQLASALGFMRSKNIVHRDIKPQNLLLQEPEPETIQAGHPAMIPQLKVADFGFARHLEAASLAETLCGSPLYMAPEILRYEKYDAKADLWSVGAVLFEMCIGKPPFRASNHVELLRKIERGEDKIKFPDERSDDSLRREQARKANDGKEASVDVVRPHTVDDDIKNLIRQLLRRRPIERMSFEDFFLSEVLQTYAQKTAARSRRSSAVNEELNSPLKSHSPSPSPVSSGFIPVAKRVAPAIPSNTNPLHRTSSKSSARTNVLSGDNNQSPASPGPGNNADGSASHAPPIVRHYFAPKYVVGGQRASQTSTPDPKPISSKGAPMLHAAVNARVSSKDSNEGEASSLEDNVLETPGSSMTHLPSSAAQTNATQKPVATPDGKSPTGAYDDDRGYVMVEKRNLDANAMAADDAYNKSKLRTAVGGWSPLGVVRRPSQLGRLASLGGVVNPLSLAGTQPTSLPQSSSSQPVSNLQGLASTSSTPTAIPASRQSSQPTKSSSPNYPRLGSTPPNAPFAVPLGARRPSFTRRPSNSGDIAPRSLTSRSSSSPLVPLSNAVANAVPSSFGSTGPGRPSSTSTTYSLSPADAVNAASPKSNAARTLATSTTPPKLTTTSEHQPATVTSSALSRAVSMASIRLFGVPTNMSMRGAGVRRSLRMGLGPGPLLSSSPGQVHASAAMENAALGSTDVAEQNLLSLLHEYGQKSFVLSEFADARLGAHYAEGPHQNNYLDQRRVSQSGMSSIISGSDLVRRSSLKSAKAHATASPGTAATPGSDTTIPPASPLPGEIAASEAYVLYVRSLSFLQRGMDAARDYMEARASSSSLGLSSRYAPSSNININGSQDVLEAMQWLRAKFADGVERAKFARSKSVEDMPESAQNVDKMIFEEALEVARRAAVDELENNRIDDHSWNGERCLLAYETACTMLQSLLDPPTESAASKDLSLSAIGTIEKFIASISKRMSSIQRKYELVHPSNVATSITA